MNKEHCESLISQIDSEIKTKEQWNAFANNHIRKLLNELNKQIMEE